MQHCPSMASLDISKGHDGLFCENWDSALQSQPTQSTADTMSSPPAVEAARPTPSPPVPAQPDPEPPHSRPSSVAFMPQSEPAEAATQNESGTAAAPQQLSPMPSSRPVHHSSSAELGSILFTEDMLRDGLPSGSNPDAAAAEPAGQSPPDQGPMVDIGPQSHIASSSGGLDVAEQASPEMTPSTSEVPPPTSQREPSSNAQSEDCGPAKSEQPKASTPSQQSSLATDPTKRPYKHDPPGRTPTSDIVKPDPERRTRPALVPPSSRSREPNGVPVNGAAVNGSDSASMRPLNRVGLAASASETARKLAPKQSQQPDEGRAHQQQQKLSDEARARLARMSSIASSAQEVSISLLHVRLCLLWASVCMQHIGMSKPCHRSRSALHDLAAVPRR